MIDKISGKVAYAVLGIGAFVGVGNDRIRPALHRWVNTIGAFVAAVATWAAVSVSIWWLKRKLGTVSRRPSS